MSAKTVYPKTLINIPPGRLISGDLVKLQTKDHLGADLPADRHHIFFALAVPKLTAQGQPDPDVQAVLGLIYNAALQGYHQQPAVLPRVQQWLAAVDFAWKIDDGDEVKAGRKTQWKDREGGAGCYIFKFSTMFAPVKTCDKDNNSCDPNQINLGDYVDVRASVSINGLADRTAGIYMNPDAVRFLAFGQRISTGVSFEEAFANTPARIPPGGMLTPPSGAGPMLLAPPAVHAAAPGMTPPPAVPNVPASVPGVPAGATPGLAVHGMQATGSPGIVSPSSLPPGTVPHVAFLQPQAAPVAAPVVVELCAAAQIAAHHKQTHHAGWRYNPQSNAYDADPLSV